MAETEEQHETETEDAVAYQPNCCWWNRTGRLLCSCTHPFTVRKDDCLLHLSSKIYGTYAGGNPSRWLINLVEQNFARTSNKDKDVYWRDFVLNTENAGGKDDEFTVRVFQPRDSDDSTPLPVIMYMHGGGFTVFSSMFRDFHDLGMKYAKEGYIVFSVSYRLAPENPFPSAVLDVYRAMEWIFKADEEEGFPKRADPSKGFVLLGDSAGGNLALVLATLVRDGMDANLSKLGERKYEITKLILAYPVLFALSADEQENKEFQRESAYLATHPPRTMLSYPIYEGYNEAYLGKDPQRRAEMEVTDRRVSPILGGLQNLPPMLLVSGGKDFLAYGANKLEEQLEAAGSKVTHVTYDKQPHGFFTFHHLNDAGRAFDRALEFLAEP